ncbi:flagellar assembly protein FliH [Massilia sp. IC2-278]|uniref:flagellar assembly protein FliH n=1 Tax=Massilia sp. IC2-278 TaxID=2887200 RepID=UPI001E63AE30|nr:flagellar assembly protein FliH [Massilia sp. IC2-278]MCC2962008.1 flagellar assembly protein FliH [Massilia sp. IC2-278]
MNKDTQGAFKRWEMNSFGDQRPSTLAARIAAEEREKAAAAAANASRIPAQAPAQSVPQVQLPTAAELEALREAARAEGYDEGLEEGRAAGYAAGHAEALEQGRLEAAAEIESLRAVASSFSTALAQADDSIASDVLDLALHLARSMVRTAFEVRPELIIPIVREAIEYLPVLQQPAVLAVHPDDIEIVRAGLGDEIDKGGWRLIADPQVARGGCKVDTASNQIDATAQARWTRLSHALGKNVEWLG